jgi:hypothetical protein
MTRDAELPETPSGKLTCVGDLLDHEILTYAIEEGPFWLSNAKVRFSDNHEACAILQAVDRLATSGLVIRSGGGDAAIHRVAEFLTRRGSYPPWRSESSW